MAGQYFVIRHARSGLLLDASEHEVKLQYFTGLALQLWTMEPVGSEYNFIVNKSNGKVMDIANGASKGARVITYQRHGAVHQQWFFNGSDQSIVSAAGNYVLDTGEGNNSAGTPIKVFNKHGGASQQFYLQYE